MPLTPEQFAFGDHVMVAFDPPLKGTFMGTDESGYYWVQLQGRHLPYAAAVHHVSLGWPEDQDREEEIDENEIE